ncbi:UNKNOWN [Stylonychia lemnae]|uniref:Uncharacterized protein n=1 Tax=Stylonychia lemnae TaxID=5949 RepID=A0A078AJR6_STYLE|nr:UNKNOWN [Stylonychia lemnae]|eukprot:CDW81053.1 UNKNOWN [Stylonychia lemnae]
MQEDQFILDETIIQELTCTGRGRFSSFFGEESTRDFSCSDFRQSSSIAQLTQKEVEPISFEANERNDVSEFQIYPTNSLSFNSNQFTLFNDEEKLEKEDATSQIKVHNEQSKIQQRLLELMNRLKSKINNIDVLLIPNSISQMTPMLFEELNEKDKILVTQIIKDDIDFSILELLIKDGTINNYETFEYSMTRMVTQRTTKLYKMFSNFKGDYENLLLSMRNTLVNKIAKLIVQKHDKRMIIENVRQNANGDYSFKVRMHEREKKPVSLMSLDINRLLDIYRRLDKL